jgi:UDP-N-acetylmuramoyl-tripeptide--D-alanyl-D-alanine ligase
MMATPIPANRVQLHRDQVLAVTDGDASGPNWQSALGVVTDSRAVQPGNLFVALRGEQFDAHRFAAQAMDAGAAAVLVERGTSLPVHVSAVEVDDTLRALGDLAKAHRRSWIGKVIGITGSVGKTTTKELCAAALQSAGCRVLKTSGNLNNRIGVPMTLFQLDETVDTAVIEMGTSQPGEIARLAEIAVPDLGIVTRATISHTEGLGSVEAVADEKVSLLHALGADGVAVVYGDDPPLKKRASVVAAKRKLFYGRSAGNDVRVIDWDVDTEGSRARFQVRGRDFEIAMALLGEGAVLNAAGALAIVLGLDLPLEEAGRGLADVKPSSGRLQPRTGSGDRLVIDDSYNSNPASLEVAIETARAIAEKRGAPFIAILGDMKELGAHSEDAHRKVGELVADADAFLFVGCGERMHEAVATANRRGTDTLWFEDAAECSELSDRLPLNAVILVKGSRSTQMERVIPPLIEKGQE